MIFDLIAVFILILILFIGGTIRFSKWSYRQLRKLLGKEDMKYTPKPKSKTVQVTLRELSALRDKASHHVESTDEFRKYNKIIVEAQKKEEEIDNLLEEEDSQDFMSGDEDW